ncbi:heavy metal-associated isoprenylated plant protein 2-like [Syzygium oleosum]|uniref:heavy metal-associated isoprenylated plant protein 2-like n=1 Tax=Syzygium oleosum TaxID=219896 RepID=UPI0011D26412|nr:heavy metal-associated isoprenylated plant protein 2-like [Syzygium oleosum]
MALKIVIKVIIKCGKDKKYIFKAVAKLEGITSITIDADKGTLTIIGTVDPVCVVLALRKKCGIGVEIVTVGPEKPPEPKKDPPKCPVCPTKCLPTCPTKCLPTCPTKCPTKCPPLCLPPPCPQPCSPPPCRYPPPCSLDRCPPRHCDYDRNSCPIL